MIEKNKAAADPETSSHIAVRPLYTPADLGGWDCEKQVGYPGQYPFTRGVQATMYRGRLWTMRQYAGMGDAEESNKRYKYLLANGTTGLSVAFDLPTQIGLDSDSLLALGEVGKVGVAIDSIEDMQRLFDGIQLTKISTSMTINATASILLALYVAVARRQGADIRKLAGTVQNDVLKEYIARGTYIYPPQQAMRIITDLFAWTNQNVPEWNTISISGYHMREAGSTAVQEVAFTLGDGIAYVQAAVKAGLDVDTFAPRLSFFFNAHSNFLEEVAKFRAARRMWARIMREQFKAKNPKSWMLRFHTQPPAQPSRRSSRRTTSCAPPSKPWRPCSAARSRCTLILSMRRWPCPPSSRRALRCAPSKSSPMNPARPKPLIRWLGRTTLNRSPTKLKNVPRNTWRKSIRWAAC